MSESQRAILGFTIIICAFVAFFAWASDFVYPALTWSGRILAPVIAIWIIVSLVRDKLRKDEVPDFIRAQGINPFERDGFFFAIVPRTNNGTLTMQVLFQNGHERSSSVQLVCKPALGFWLQDLPLAQFTLDLACSPGGFGIAEVPMAVPKEYQGKEITYELGARVRYPMGRGKRLLHNTGIHVGKPVFTTRSRAFLSVVGVFGGFHMGRPASFRFVAPQAVATHLAQATPPRVEHKWKLGDETPNQASHGTAMPRRP
ncbi:MAG: hypothetical protein PHR35_13145 [Kiritimatiellae bacterium]|nr:hypothetical protein [Kiritimatiellia bacterium]